MADRERRRAQILQRARDVFARKGYHQAKIDDIVAAAGVARGTFYLYFHDKRSIFEELVNRFFQTIAMAVGRIDVKGDVEEQIKGNVSRILAVCQEDPGMTKILLADAIGLDAEFDRRLLAFYADLEALLEASLGEGQELGIVQAGDRRVRAHFLLGGVKEVVLQLVRAPVPVDREAVARDVFALLARGILVSPKRPTTRTRRKK
ncbi:MAG: TetR/AcrR family transcriptional regulator [Polyangiales bacterium]